MLRLIYYEFIKIWHKRGFLISICVLLCSNIFLLWYVNASNEEKVPLSAYKSFQKQIEHMTEVEKYEYVSQLKETIDGVSFVQEVLNLEKLQNEMGNTLVEQAISANPGVFETYHEIYQNESYLNFTDTFWQEKEFIDMIYAEQQKVADYEKYLASIQENADTLHGISIFETKEKESFAWRNIEKSEKDYADLSSENICWWPSKVFSIALETIWTDLLLILSVFLFVGNVILEEKEKKLFYIIRSTKNGYLQTIVSKMIAFFLHCTIITMLLYGENLLFAEITVGFGDFMAQIQSISTYMESNLPICIGAYVIVSILTKIMFLFAIGTILTTLCIYADTFFLPYLVAVITYGISYVLYVRIPVGETSSLFKYINGIGLLKTENLYGSYFNFNIFGYPISRLLFSWEVMIACIWIGVGLSILLYLYGEKFELKKIQLNIQKKYGVHGSLLRHEAYKILIVNGAAAIMLIFGCFIGIRIMNQEYHPSVQEQYYQELMFQLEGELTEEKEALILSEQERYEKAFSEIERIEAFVSNGEMDAHTGDDLKAKWYAVTFFYPSFERVLMQYERIREKGGMFVYDTGYLYLFGKKNDDYLVDFLLYTLCIIIAFSNTIVMEYQKGMWYLLCATQKGKWRVLWNKALICMTAVMGFSVIPFICRGVNVSSVYPLHELGALITDIPAFSNVPWSVPIWGFMLILILSQMVFFIAIVLIVLAISYWRKNHMQSIFFSLLILVVPFVWYLFLKRI